MGNHVDGFPDKDGIDKLVKLGKALCNTVSLFAPLLAKKYPDNVLIKNLLIAIQGVCALLPEIESEFLLDSGQNDDLITNPEGAAGIDPSRPAAPAGDIT